MALAGKGADLRCCGMRVLWATGGLSDGAITAIAHSENKKL